MQIILKSVSNKKVSSAPANNIPASQHRREGDAKASTAESLSWRGLKGRDLSPNQQCFAQEATNAENYVDLSQPT
jgi:hypothetical protein